MPKKNEYLEFLLEWLSPLGTITARSMFGGHCLYCDGVVFALLADGVPHLKVDDATRPRFERLGLAPFRPFPNQPEVMQYYPPPPEFFEDRDALLDWGRAAVEVGRRAKTKKRRALSPG
ncbi:MAG: TfoX/Sxy family protein [Acidobacteria bacterium]|nr:TfoX/Sxy family protein [Acidobacteriota bacterium]